MEQSPGRLFVRRLSRQSRHRRRKGQTDVARTYIPLIMLLSFDSLLLRRLSTSSDHRVYKMCHETTTHYLLCSHQPRKIKHCRDGRRQPGRPEKKKWLSRLFCTGPTQPTCAYTTGVNAIIGYCEPCKIRILEEQAAARAEEELQEELCRQAGETRAEHEQRLDAEAREEADRKERFRKQRMLRFHCSSCTQEGRVVGERERKPNGGLWVCSPACSAGLLSFSRSYRYRLSRHGHRPAAP